LARRLCICATVLLVAFGALGSDRDCTRDRAPRVILSRAGEGSSPVMTQGIEIVVVRIGADGKPMYACVDNAAAAKRFLEAPLEKITVREAREK